MWSIKRLFGKRKKIEHYEIEESFQNSFENDNTRGTGGTGTCFTNKRSQQ